MAFIVGAALRYQLGDEDRQPRFAPVFLDEGFIKSDSEFASRSIEAWKKLGFQLIVGVPLDKVTALEPAMRLILTVTKSPDGYSYLTRLRGIDDVTPRPPPRPAAVKTPDQVVADVTARLRRTWPHAVAGDVLRGTAPGGERVSGDSDPWPHSFPLGAPGRRELEQQFAAYQAKTLALRQWYATQAGAGVELVDAARRVHGTVQAIATHLRVADIDAAAGLSGPEWAARLARARTRGAALVERFMPVADLPRMLREVDRLGRRRLRVAVRRRPMVPGQRRDRPDTASGAGARHARQVAQHPPAPRRCARRP